jgi:hypothetical protein
MLIEKKIIEWGIEGMEKLLHLARLESFSQFSNPARIHISYSKLRRGSFP